MTLRQRNILLVIALFFLVTIAVYGSSVRGNFFVDWDDYRLVVQNPILQELSLKNVARAFSSYDPELYIPLTFMSYQVDRLIGGGFSPQVTHGINLLIHTLNSLLVAWVLGRLVRDRRAGIIAGLLFAVHPMNTEAVAWASARKDLLSSFFFLFSWGSYLMMRDCDIKKRSSALWYALSLWTFFLALLAKIVSVPLPVILILTDFLQGRKFNRKMWTEKIPYFVFSFFAGIIGMLGKFGGSSLLYEKILIGCRALFLYLGKLILPVKFSVLYPFTKEISFVTPELFFSVLGIFVLTKLAMQTIPRTRVIAVAWMFFLVTALPSMTNFTKSDYYKLDVYIGSDRYAYLPSIGFFLLVAFLAHIAFDTRKKIVCATAAICVVLLGSLAHAQSLMWSDTGTLFVNVLQYYPNSHLAHNNVGAILEKRGHIDLAIREFEQSVAVRPNERAYFNLGQIYLQRSDTARAKLMFEKAIEQDPEHVDSMVNLGVILLSEKQFDRAIELFTKAIALKPDLPQAPFNLAMAYERSSQKDKAVEWYRKVLEKHPDDTEAQARLKKLLR